MWIGPGILPLGGLGQPGEVVIPAVAVDLALRFGKVDVPKANDRPVPVRLK